MSEEIRGVLSRRKGIFYSWSKFTYVKKGSYLFEYKLGSNPVNSEPLMTFDIEGSLIEDGHNITGNPASFVFHTNFGKSHFFLAPSLTDKKKWIDALTPDSQKKSASNASLPLTQQQQQQQQQVQQVQQQQKPNEPAPAYEDVDYNKLSLAELENRIPLLKFLESFTDPVIVGTINGSIVTINSAASKLFGIPQSESKGKPLVDLMPEPYKSQHDGYLFRHEKFGTEKLIGKTRGLKGTKSSGEVFDLQISLGKLPLPGFFLATIRDVNVAMKEEPEKA